MKKEVRVRSSFMSAKITSGYCFFCMGMLNYNKEKD